MRARVLAANTRNNNGRCTLRLPGCTVTATQVHHVLGKQHGDNERYLVACCAQCNGKVGDPDKWRGPAPKPHSNW